MPVLENHRWERFAQGLAQGKTADEAYQTAGYKENRHNASRLKANETILSRVSELQQKAATRTEVTIEDLVAEMDENRELALKNDQISAAVAATTAKAKMLGLIIERSERGKPGEFDQLTTEQKRERATALVRQLGLSNTSPVSGSA